MVQKCSQEEEGIGLEILALQYVEKIFLKFEAMKICEIEVCISSGIAWGIG